nr:hypothetical protein [Tanacetum cinerariifolium]
RHRHPPPPSIDVAAVLHLQPPCYPPPNTQLCMVIHDHYPDVQENPLTNDEFEAFTTTNDANMNNLQFKFDNIQKDQQDFQMKYEQKRGEFLNQMRNFMQNIHDGLQIPPPGVIREECCINVSEEQKQKMDDTKSELVEICRHKELLCMYDNVEDLIEGTLDTKLLSINSQCLDKKKLEITNHAENSLQNFRVIHKNSISLNSTSQISSVHTVAPILSTKEPELSLSMGYEHLSITPETESNEVTKSSAKNLLPIPSECEVTSENENECDMPAKDDSSPDFITFSNPIFNDDLDKSLPKEDVPAKDFKVYLNRLFDHEEINSDKLDPHCFNVEYDFVESLLNRDTLIDSSSKFDFLLKEFSGELAHINPISLENKEASVYFEEEIHFS